MKRYHRLTPRGSRHQADMFFADLVGEPTYRTRRYPRAVPARWSPAPSTPPHEYPAGWHAPRPETPAVPDDEGFEEAVPLGGRGSFRHEPLGGIPGDNVAARWNVDAATPSGSTIDIVVHLHGYSDKPDDAQFLPRKTAAAGVDLVDDAGAVRVRTSQPTLALVPRGRH